MNNKKEGDHGGMGGRDFKIATQETFKLPVIIGLNL